MKLILTNEVSGLGVPGDIVDVKDGYARNFLLPRGLGTPWTRGGQKQVDSIRKARESRAIKSLGDAQTMKARLESTVLTISARAGKGGRLFGAVSPADVAAAAEAAGLTLDRRLVEFAAPIRSTGPAKATVALHPEVKASLSLTVISA
jgi:large subunit ribosomal protein L9